MKHPFRLARRGRFFWSHDSESGRQESLDTRDHTNAKRLLHARNEAHAPAQPAIESTADRFSTKPHIQPAAIGPSTAAALAIARRACAVLGSPLGQSQCFCTSIGFQLSTQHEARSFGLWSGRSSTLWERSHGFQPQRRDCWTRWACFAAFDSARIWGAGANGFEKHGTRGRAFPSKFVLGFGQAGLRNNRCEGVRRSVQDVVTCEQLPTYGKAF